MYAALAIESQQVITPTPRDFEIYEAFAHEVTLAGSPARALGKVADTLHVSVGQVAESCCLVQQLTRRMKTATPPPQTPDRGERAIPGEREDDTKEIVLRLHHALDKLAQGATESAAIGK